MLDKISFKESLDALVELAKAQENILSMDEIKKHFEDLELSDKQFNLVYEFLMASKITVKHYVPNSDKFDTTNKDIEEEANTHLSMYLEELEGIKSLSVDEMNALAQKVLAGDEKMKAELVQGLLKYVIELTKGFMNQGVAVGDLIQEGNMALMLGVNEYITLGGSMEFHKFIRNVIEKALKFAIDEDYDDKNNENIVLDKVNKLTDVTKELAEELEREATLEEIADRMKLSEDEVKDIMRISLEALGVEHSHSHDHEH